MSSPLPAGSSPGPPREGWVDGDLAAELPGLRLLFSEVQVGRTEPLDGLSPPDIRERLRELSNRVRGARAIGARVEPVTSAYRVFFHQVGMDPDAEMTPLEDALLERMFRGGFPSHGLLADILRITLLDTGVPLWALDADRLHGEPGIRQSDGAESLGGASVTAHMPAGRLVVADERSAVAVVFGEQAPDLLPGPGTGRVLLYAILVGGVPAIFAEESLWNAANALAPTADIRTREPAR